MVISSPHFPYFCINRVYIYVVGGKVGRQQFPGQRENELCRCVTVASILDFLLMYDVYDVRFCQRREIFTHIHFQSAPIGSWSETMPATQEVKDKADHVGVPFVFVYITMTLRL